MNGGGSPQPAQSSVELRQVLAVLSKWRWLIAVLTGASVLTAAVFSVFVLPKVYRATTTLDISYALPSQQQAAPPQLSGGNLQGVIQTVSTVPQNTIDTYQWQVTNPVVLAAASKTLAAKGITLSPGVLGGLVTTSTVPNTNLLLVSVDDTNPAAAAAVANVLAQSYLQTVQKQTTDKLNQAVAFLTQQASTVKKQLDAAQAALSKASSAPGAGPSSAAQLQADDNEMGSLSSSLVDAQVKLQAAQAGLAALQQQAAATPPTLPVRGGSSSPAAASTGAGSATSGSAAAPAAPSIPNPAYQSLQQQIGSQQVQVAEDQAAVTELQRSIAAVQADARSLSSRTVSGQANLKALQAQVEQLTQTYQTLTASLTQAHVTASLSLGNAIVTVAAPATVPTVPIKPNKKRNVGLALLLGLVVSVGASFLLEQLDDTVKSPEDIQRLAALPTLAVIPHAGGGL